jgi:hypothetical protein
MIHQQASRTSSQHVALVSGYLRDPIPLKKERFANRLIDTAGMQRDTDAPFIPMQFFYLPYTSSAYYAAQFLGGFFLGERRSVAY